MKSPTEIKLPTLTKFLSCVKKQKAVYDNYRSLDNNNNKKQTKKPKQNKKKREKKRKKDVLTKYSDLNIL